VIAELVFSVRDLAQLRFAVSPMWQLGPSVRLLRAAPRDPIHRTWVEQVRPRLAAAGFGHGWLAELVPPTGYVPDFLNPAPAGPATELPCELAAIRATAAARVRDELDRLRREQGGLGPRLRRLYADPAAELPRLTAEIDAYWQLALAPYWARMRAVLDADVFYRARLVAEHGAGRLFDTLHPAVNWDDGALRVAGGRRRLARQDTGPGLLLIPSVFTGPGLFTQATSPDPPQLAYPARGAAVLWQRRPRGHGDALAAVLGRSRAMLLAELDTPASTTELARRTGLSAAGVSQYLTALRHAGLVSAHRAGRWVLYARTAAGEAVLAAAPPPARQAGDR
jgi:DNA-binding transcriptional ArsR family regulator